VYVVFVGVLFAAGVNAGLIVVIAGGMALLQLFASDKMALAAMGAREVSPAEAEERDRADEDAERARPRPLAQERDRLRDHPHQGSPVPRRARGRHGA